MYKGSKAMYVNGVEVVKYASTIQSNVSNVTHVECVKDGGCGFHATLHTEVENSLYAVASHPFKREGNAPYGLPSCGFSGNHQAV